MSQLIWLNDCTTPFPPSHLALTEPDGLLAASENMNSAQVLRAYHNGIFPWFNRGEPALWWTPAKRMVLFCQDFKTSKSLHKRLKKIAHDERSSGDLTTNKPHIYRVSTDLCFKQVITHCGQLRADTGTWINTDIISVYHELHRLGYAHSVETWFEGQLVGGLYGMSIGQIFFGESMFTKQTDCSKIALSYLINFLRLQGTQLIDCQQVTPHLASLGAKPIPRQQFENLLRQYLVGKTPNWQANYLNGQGKYVPTSPIQNML